MNPSRAHTVALVRLLQQTPLPRARKRSGRLPPQLQPDHIRLGYYRALLPTCEDARAAFLRELPQILHAHRAWYRETYPTGKRDAAEPPFIDISDDDNEDWLRKVRKERSDNFNEEAHPRVPAGQPGGGEFGEGGGGAAPAAKEHDASATLAKIRNYNPAAKVKVKVKTGLNADNPMLPGLVQLEVELPGGTRERASYNGQAKSEYQLEGIFNTAAQYTRRAQENPEYRDQYAAMAQELHSAYQKLGGKKGSPIPSIAVTQHFEDIGLGDVHSSQSRGWVDSSDSRPARLLHAEWKAQGVPGSEHSRGEGRAASYDREVSPEKLRAYMHEMRSLTQASLKADGVKEIKLYRGVNGMLPDSKKGDEVAVRTRPASSWTDKPEVARKFLGSVDGSGILSMTVPAEKIYTYHGLFGNGSSENEYVVLGAQDVPAKVETVVRDGKTDHLDVSDTESEDWLRRPRTDAASPKRAALAAIDRAQATFLDNLRPHELDAVAQEFGKRTTDFQKAQLDKQVRAAIGVPYSSIEKPTRDLVPGWAALNVDLIKTVPERYFDRLRQDVELAYETGMATDTLVEKFEDDYGIQEDDAARIARDQIGKLNGQVNQDRQQALGVERFIWRGMNDQRERPEHVEFEAQSTEEPFTWDDPPIDENGEQVIPGSPIQCVPGEALVSLHAPAVKAYRRRYTGDLTEFVTSSGETLCTTPNHPVLTRRGWLAAHLVEVGDHLVEAPEERFDLDVADPQGRVAHAEELFRALSVGRPLLKRVSGSSGFHGDAVDQDVDVVDVDRSLFDERETHRAEAIGENLFTGSAESSATKRHLAFHFVRTRTARGFMSSGSEAQSFDATHMRHAHEHSRALVPGLDVVREQDASNQETTPTVLLGKSEFAYAAKVGSHDLRFRKIERVTRRAYDGWVYNFETTTGWFSSHGLTISNCRCYAEPVLADILGEEYQAPDE